MEVARSGELPGELDWDRFKDTIHALFMKKHITLERIMEIMLSDHGFKATKAQYERRLKYWGVRKNLKKTEWPLVAKAVEKRKLNGKDSAVYLDGKRLCREKVEKGITRYMSSTYSEPYPSAKSPILPVDIIVSTPSTHGTPNSISGTPRLASSSFRLEKLPFRLFEKALNEAILLQSRRTFVVIDPDSHRLDLQGLLRVEHRAPRSHAMIEDISDLAKEADFGHFISSSHDSGRRRNAQSLLQGILGEAAVEIVQAEAISDAAQQNIELIKLLVCVLSNDLLGLKQKLQIDILNWLQDEDNKELFTQLRLSGGPIVEAFAERLLDGAVHSRDMFLVKYLLELGVDPNCLDLSNWPLSPSKHYTTYFARKDYEIYRLLIATGAALEGYIDPCYKILENAIKDHDIDLVKMMLDDGVSINPIKEAHPHQTPGIVADECNVCRTNSRTPPLLIAVGLDDIESVIVLLKAGADVNIKHFQPALWIAARYCSISLIDVLLKAGADVNQESHGTARESVLMAAMGCRYDDFCYEFEFEVIEVSKKLLAAGAALNFILTSGEDISHYDPNPFDCRPKPGDSLLDVALKQGWRDLTKILLDAGAQVTTRSTYCAAIGGDTVLLESVIALGADVNGYGPSSLDALKVATKWGRTDMVELLLSRGADVNNERTFHKIRHEGGHFQRLVLTALQFAVDTREVELVRSLLNARADVNARGGMISSAHRDLHSFSWYYGGFDYKDLPMTALRIACLQHSLPLVKILLEAGAELSDDEDVPSALMIATHDEHILAALIQSPQYSNCAGRLGVDEPLLHTAILSNTRSATYLFEHDVDINTPSKEGEVPVVRALQTKNWELARLLLSKGADVNPISVGTSRLTPLAAAVDTTNLDLFFEILNKGADPNDPRALDVAAFLGCEFLVEYFLTIGLSPEDSVLTSAAEGHHVSVMRLLLASRSRLVDDGGPFYGVRALCVAISRKELDIVKCLVFAGINIDAPLRASGTKIWQWNEVQDGENALALAVRTYSQGNAVISAISMLLAHGANPNMARCNLSVHFEATVTRPAFTFIVGEGRVQLVKDLLASGADPNHTSFEHDDPTPLEVATTLGSLELVRILLDAGARVNALPQRVSGKTALQAAAAKGVVSIAIVLMEAGANVNAPGSPQDGYTALEFAAANGRMDMVQLLLDNGAEIHGEFGERQFINAVKFARKGRHMALARMMETYRASRMDTA